MAEFDPQDEPEWEGGPIDPKPVDPNREEQVHRAQKDFEKYEDPSLGLDQELPDAEDVQLDPVDAPIDDPGIAPFEDESGDLLERELETLPLDVPPAAVPDLGDTAFEVMRSLADELPVDGETAPPQTLLEAFEQGVGPGQEESVGDLEGLPPMPEAQDSGEEADLSNVFFEFAEEDVRGRQSIADILRDLTRQMQGVHEALERARL